MGEAAFPAPFAAGATPPARAPRAADPLPRAVSIEGRIDPDAVAARIAAEVAACDPALVLVFAAPAADLGRIGAALGPRLGDATVAGCSSAGGLGVGGYAGDGAVAIAFPRAGFAVETVVLDRLAENAVTRWMADLRAASARLHRLGHAQLVGLVLADGLTRREDVLAATLDASLPGVPVLGGCAGNGLDFTAVAVLAEGAALTDAAVVCLLGTDLPIGEIVYQHFTPTGQRCVVTAADPGAHAILELNAEPAAAEYARLAGLDPAVMGPVDFARNPLLLRAGPRHHVRAISAVREDGGLQLLSSIDVGAVLTLGRAEDLTQGFADTLAALPRRPALILGFDCVLRRLALVEAGLQDEVATLCRDFRIRGFSTYGELHDGMHCNQTFVGLAIYPPDGADG